MNDPPWLAEGWLKRLAHAPRSVILLVCLCLLGLGIFIVIQRLLSNFGDETSRRVILVFLADLNGDEHQDAFLVTNQMHRIVFNDGQGNLSGSEQRLGMSMTHTIFMSTLDADGDLFLGGTSIRVWLNDGAEQFTAGQRINVDHSDTVAIGDVTGDNNPDVFVGGPTWYQVWRGDDSFSADSRSAYR